MTDVKQSSRSCRTLKEGEQCPACYRVVRFPLSHVCDARHVNASIVNDVGDYIVNLGEEQHRFHRAVFISMVRGSAPSETAATPIWALEAGFDYEGYDLIGIFATEADAETAKSNAKGYDSLRVNEWKIGEFHP